MNNYTYQNNLISKKQLRQLLAWSFTKYDSMQACSLADELKYLGFRYASKAGISISLEDLRIPFVKNLILEKANQEIDIAEKVYFKGKITEVERFQKIIDTWSLTSESLKNQIIYFFKNYDPLNSVYIMAFSGARGNLSQVRQLVGMRGLMSDPSGQIMNLPIKKNFREGLTITDYLMSGYGARKGIVDTALKTANSGYLTRRLIDVAQDILIREKDCFTKHALIFFISKKDNKKKELIYEKILGRILNKSVFDPINNILIAEKNSQITPILITKFNEKKITKLHVRSPLTCKLYRAICQNCYGWDLANENIIDIGEAIGILAGQSIGEPGTQLTMRTFHTGGIFNAETREQIISPFTGIIKFNKFLNTVSLRTNRGEEVLVTRNSGFLILIPNDRTQDLIKIEVLRNTILFPKNNQYVLKNTVLGELINTKKQIKSEIKPILSDISGEIFIPRLKQNINLLNNNKLIWILFGKFYNSPTNSFLNFYSDYKLNHANSIFRTKLINHNSGSLKFINNHKNLYQRSIRISNNKCSFIKFKLQELNRPLGLNNYLLSFNNYRYFTKIWKKTSSNLLQTIPNKEVGVLNSNSFKTFTGGILYYALQNLIEKNNEIDYFFNFISYYDMTYFPEVSYLNKLYLDEQLYFDRFMEILKIFLITPKRRPFYRKPFFRPRTIIWLGEESYKVKCKETILLVSNGDFISKGFELIPGLFSKISGFVILTLSQKKKDIVETISIKSGIVYEGNKFKNKAKKLYYPGEIIFSNIIMNKLSFCEHIIGKNIDQLLVRPVEIYEYPWSNISYNKLKLDSQDSFYLNFEFQNVFPYKSNQVINSSKNIDLISNVLLLKNFLKPSISSNIELFNSPYKNFLSFKLIEELCLTRFSNSGLKYTNLQSSFLVQKNQFISKYTIIGYLEAIIQDSLEIVKIKVKKQSTKQILVISNQDCSIITKKEIQENKFNSLVNSEQSLNKIGKVLIENNDNIIIQKGKPYFFPNCKKEYQTLKPNLQYKLFPCNRIFSHLFTNRKISLNYFNFIKLTVEKTSNLNSTTKNQISFKFKFSKFFLKNKGKLYSCLVPRFYRQFIIGNKRTGIELNKILFPLKESKIERRNRILFLQNFKTTNNKIKLKNQFKYQLMLLKFVEHPFSKSNRSVGLYSLTEDYFEKDVNSLFCKNKDFIEAGTTIGLLHLEKEITGDIVQGLPRIEEILEARKKNSKLKRIPTSQKNGLLTQKTTLDPTFEFRKLGIVIKENDKINPHKLLKVYFNYYGLTKYFLCDRLKKFKYNRLIKNYEASYKSFQKVQLFILNSVQSVYDSQGVTINNKHLEVIIKQMTTKVLITSEGNTPLFRRELIDLYHINCMNNILNLEKKSVAYYVPFLMGVTKAALNNPSFISAASFQETTRVLTKAAIEGRIDWLRGLKENIIIGHLIPAGTGSPNYQHSFKKYINKTIDFHKKFTGLMPKEQKS